MASPKFDLENFVLLLTGEPPTSTATEISFRHEMQAEFRRRQEIRAEHAARFLDEHPPKPLRFSKSGVPLVKEKE